MNRYFHNPVIPGFYPDPSICRVDEDYYLVTSSFEFFPGVPIWHSRDLVNWRQIGHVLDRPSQLNLDGLSASAGIYAPTIRYHDGVYYMITTLVDRGERQDVPAGNFIVTATDPAGPWSDPYWLEGAPGIDPSLLFDDDGRVWYTGNRVPDGHDWRSHIREIWLQELDLTSMQLVGETYGLWRGALVDAVHAEAPHLYKIDGLYYLMIAEGGTAHQHAVTIARSETVTGPYQGNLRNPILTHRHLGRTYPITNTGHADIVQTPNGEWWMVALASRPYGGYFYNLGRETWLMPVIWEDGWPIVSPGTGKIEWSYPAPQLPQHRWAVQPARDHFVQPTLQHTWNFLRTPREDFWSLEARPGWLRLRLRPESLVERSCPSFVGRRQQHINFLAETRMAFTPQASHECAGLVLLQNDNHQFRFTCTLDDEGQPVLQVIRREAGQEQILAQAVVSGPEYHLKVEAIGQDYSFYYNERAQSPPELEAWQPLAERADGRILSTPVAGGFTGAYIGLYASSHGQPSDNTADFDWFDYEGL